MRETSPDAKDDIWKLPLLPDGKSAGGGGAVPLFADAVFRRERPLLAGTESRWVAYTSDESATREVYVDAFPEPRGKKRISTAGGATGLEGARAAASCNTSRPR